MSKIRVAFIPTNVSGVAHYRVRQPADALKKAGCDVAVLWYGTRHFSMHPWEEDLCRDGVGQNIYRDVDMACQWADVVIWMGLHTPYTLQLFKTMKTRHGKFFVTEMDDYIFSLPSSNIASTVYAPGSGLTQILIEQMKASDALVVSTPYLGELYKKFAKKVYVLENVIDLSLWPRPASPAAGQRDVNIGWMGGGSHGDDFRVVEPAIRSIQEKFKNTRFTFVSGGVKPSFLDGIPRLKWVHDFRSIDRYPKWIGKFGFDIGIAPLQDNNFNRGKSNLRWLEHSALGIPCVASPLPHFVESISPCATGYLANNTTDWVYYLSELVSAPKLRETIGIAARQEIKDKWSLKTLGRKYKAAIEDMLNARTNSPTDSGAHL